MRVKKLIKIDNFDNFSNKGVQVDEFYNFRADKKLTSSIGVSVAKFPTDLNTNEMKSLNIKIN